MMSVLLVIFWYRTARTSTGAVLPGDLAALRRVLGNLPGLEKALIFTPAEAQDSFTDDGPSPPLGVQLHFADIAALEAAAATDGGLQTLCANGFLSGLDHCQAEAQAFLARDYRVEDAAHAADARPCSFVVHYPGPAEDTNAWHGIYISSHAPLMARLPGIRALEILTPVDWISHLPIPSVRNMQRNRVLFDSPEALTAALQSPIRHELRADFHALPAFKGGNYHYAMLTETLRPRRA